MELHLSCTNPLICGIENGNVTKVEVTFTDPMHCTKPKIFYRDGKGR